MSDPRKELWEKRKQLGRSKYLILFGLLPWGIGLTILTSIIEIISFKALNPVWIPIRLLVFFFIGFFVANARWHAMETRYEPYVRRP
ncbi:hypothetical protein GCM10008018_08110 [Paenibacillus marchantiophytorum]|uniref:Uncharacterized protein n=1 Tax=Paenibacillus marchantiophytorum TaxID=1619310 RepID=A0ABQ2BRS0_9BACL|nr:MULTISPECIES: hypothetical protein [Paenibacillus]UKS24188.1 hypothetical protein LOZ80_21425 [Paenibacillus sp. HWE-109]GGI44639.1 hypothetical protein GCM10008018_08110 [Paenibacillus marchantiophytorum]